MQRRLRFLVLVAIVLSPSILSADPLPSRSDRIVDYAIDVRLDAVKKTLAGSERLTWRNPSGDAVGELWFHLYLNAFRNNRSTFFRESGGQLRGDSMPDDGWGWIDVTRLRIAGGPDLTRAMTFEQPDDGNRDDRTVMKVVLPAPVPPGESVTLDIGFSAQLPRVFARTGYAGDYFLVGQWFPKIGVYEPAGTRGRSSGGWNCHQFHANSEFYADYGTYRVTITLPSRFVVGATGERKAVKEHADGTTSYTYEQADVHDFAWTADPRFVEIVRTFSATQDVTSKDYEDAARLLGRTLDDVQLSDVQIRLLLQPGHEPQIERHIQAAKHGLKYFGLWYGRYPYRTLTVVDPAFGAGGSGGMEYPTFITAGTSMLLNRGPLSGMRAPELVTIHEFGHQFWYGLVANNEFEEPWLDEGFNSYSTGRITDLAYGRTTSVAALPWMTIGEEEVIRAQNSPWRVFDRIRQSSWTFSPGAYAFYAYTKPELVLRTLEHHLGRETMARVMRTYHERWRFRHPSSDDFYAVASEVAGRDLSWFFTQYVEGTGALDYELSSVSSERQRKPEGLIEVKGARTLVKPDAREREGDDTSPFEHRILVKRLGDATFPVTLLLRYEGGTSERLAWDGRERWKRIVLTGPRRLVSAELDPDRHLTVETNRLNNTRRLEPDRRVAVKWSARWLFWMQNLLAVMGL